VATVMTQPASVRAGTAPRIYVPVGFVCALIALLGFWPTYFGPLLLKGIPHPLPVIHLHATVFMTWVLLVITQAWLAAGGRVALHMKVGRYGMSWGVVVIIIGWTTAFFMFGERVQAGNFAEAERRLLAPLTDMLFFAPVLAAAWIYRRKPEIHKRLIIVGTTILLIAAVHRMVFLGGRPPPLPQLLAVWLSPILFGMIYDFVKRRMVHPVYLIGIGVVLLMKFGRSWIRGTETWSDFTTWLATYYA
jgi:uncharacterized membrane protein YozB (DUF420 family)